MAKITMNPKKLKKGDVRITDKNTGRSKDKPSASLGLGGSMRESTRATIDSRNKRLNKAIDDASGHRRRAQ